MGISAITCVSLAFWHQYWPNFPNHWLLYSQALEVRDENLPQPDIKPATIISWNAYHWPMLADSLCLMHLIIQFGKKVYSIYLLKFVFIKPFPNKPWFLHVCSIVLSKTLWEKEKLLVTSNFSFSHSVFYPFGELYAIFIKFKIVVCKLFQFGRV